jgi:asparagine synthase (glutamine-hydrolysing)
MSVQFGTWNFDGQPSTPDYIEKVSTTLAPYGPDGDGLYANGGVTMLYRAFHTTKESYDETQPAVTAFGPAITWDGRLDNRSELIAELRNGLTVNSTDIAIVATAYQKWGENCFCKLIGEWALSIWNPLQRSLTLAKDSIGSRHLYYYFDDKRITWCTILDPLVQFGGRKFEICEEYVANWLINRLPAPHVTPYLGVQAVPPSCFVLLRPGTYGTIRTISRYWDFDPDNKIRYRTDAEYHEHFRCVFGRAVQRCLRSDRPVLAELSGGMDSSSIVCMADLIMGIGAQRNTRCQTADTSPVECPRVDTISWYGDVYGQRGPDTNEFLWISKVEQKRGRAGFHINFDKWEPKKTGALERLISGFECGGFASTPPPKTLSRLYHLYAVHMASAGYRVTISGVGGDGATGKEPTPLPELQNLLASGRLIAFIRQLSAWASMTEKPRKTLLWETIREFLPQRDHSANMLDGLWFCSEFNRRNCDSLCVRPTRVKLLGPLPSFQHNLRNLDDERRLAASWDPTPNLVREMRYPFLDRDFLSFVYAIPRDQVVREGHRRFLMKQALVGIVPDEVLRRERKTFVRPQSEIEKERNRAVETLASVEIGQHLVSGWLGIVAPDRFSGTLQKVSRKEETSALHMLKRTLWLELWLRHLAGYQVLATPNISDMQAESLKTRGAAFRPPVEKFS